MALIDELKEMRAQARDRMAECLTHADSYNQLAAIARDHIGDLDRAIAALEPAVEATLEPDEEASSQSEPFSMPAETDRQTSPGEVEESRDHSDDASEFSEEGYAPVTQAEPPAMEGVAFVDGKWTIPRPSFEEMDDDGLEPGPVDEASHPMAAYVPATDPQADALAKAADYYSPENVAERNRFDPFRMFKRETEES